MLYVHINNSQLFQSKIFILQLFMVILLFISHILLSSVQFIKTGKETKKILSILKYASYQSYQETFDLGDLNQDFERWIFIYRCLVPVFGVHRILRLPRAHSKFKSMIRTILSVFKDYYLISLKNFWFLFGRNLVLCFRNI